MNFGASQVMLEVKNLPANAWGTRNGGSIPGSGRSPGGEHGNPLQYSGLKNPTDRGAWRAIGHEVTKSRTRLKRLSMQSELQNCCGDFIFYMDLLSLISVDNYPF